MAKTLKQFKQGYSPKAADEKKFVDKHTVTTTPDANGNDDELFKASNVKMVDRETEHGYNPGSDEEVYESAGQVDEKMNLKTAKMGDVVKDFQKSKAPQFAGKSKEKRREMAVAAKLQAEEIEQVEEAEKVAKHRPGWMLRADKKLGNAAKQAKKMNQLMARFGGKPEAGKTVKEGVMGNVPSPSAEKPKLWKPSKEQKWKVVHKDTGKARGEWDKPVDAVKHLKSMPAELQKTHTIVKEEEHINELSAETRKSYILKAAPQNKLNPTKKRSVGIQRALFAPKKDGAETRTEEVDVQAEEMKKVVDKSGAIHTPMSRARHLAKLALKKQIEKHAQGAAAEVTKKKVDEEIDYDSIKTYLLSVYEDKSLEEKNMLNEMLQTEEGTKLAFVVTYFSGE